ncbi:MAG: dephospho-CoA kinase [Deltaproteobacteria bacterium]
MQFTPPKHTKIWGLTGGIGSGKSLAARFFKEAGVSVINLDLLGKEILDNDPDVAQELKNLFGSHIVKNGVLDRKAIRELVFNSPSHRKKLEQILHPRIWKKFECETLREANQGVKLILCEAALLIEHAHSQLFPRLIVVLASTDIRKHRVHQRDQMDFSLIDQILQTQVDDEARKKSATDLLINEGTPEDLKKSVLSLIENWKQKNIL